MTTKCQQIAENIPRSDYGIVYEYNGTEYNKGIWSDIIPETGDILSCGDFHEYKGKITEENKKSLWLLPGYMSGSDYSGDLVEKSNHKVFLEKFGDIDGVNDIQGGYNTYGVAIRLDVYDTNEDVRDIIDNFGNNLVIDDDAYYEMEKEVENEAWDNWIRSDLIKSVQNKLETCFFEDDVEKILEGYDISLLYFDARSEMNEYVQFGTGGEAYIDVEVLAKYIVDYILLESADLNDLSLLTDHEWTKPFKDIASDTILLATTPQEDLPLFINHDWATDDLKYLYSAKLEGLAVPDENKRWRMLMYYESLLEEFNDKSELIEYDKDTNKFIRKDPDTYDINIFMKGNYWLVKLHTRRDKQRYAVQAETEAEATNYVDIYLNGDYYKIFSVTSYKG